MSPTQANILMGDLRNVGPDKPLGYLPIRAITNVCCVQIEEAIDGARKRGLLWRQFAEDACHVGSGALYVWDREALQALLNANANMLAAKSWPLETENFVEAVATIAVHEEQDAELYELIGVAFADERFRHPQFVRSVASEIA